MKFFTFKNFNLLSKYLLLCTYAKCKFHTCAKFLNLSRVNAVSLQCRRDMSEVKKKWQDLQSSANNKE